ncbi:uncharacterized protein BXZ73DRAFT_62226 [Epithele typhae]|uniref:uncharacterized protein n=1 Tax=Epithele typhae TaxID=378194 RepID=UPI0020087BFC|nr:uncharacterized protein BXZ73DRAFT_62226 [Epithele typhae]KAH9903894.1 hypothetical protein BXZ73DRAFT_62226 [Epithele typhae]
MGVRDRGGEERKSGLERDVSRNKFAHGRVLLAHSRGECLVPGPRRKSNNERAAQGGRRSNPSLVAARGTKHAPCYRDGDWSSEDELSRKRPKPDRSLYPWIVNKPIPPSSVRPIVKRLVEQYRNFSLDIMSTLTNLLNSPGLPELTACEWDNILCGRPVDLDQVFISRYPTASSSVKSSGDRFAASQDASAAYAFALPELAPVCVTYGKQIISLFASLHESLAGRVLDYDRAIRKRVASNRNLLFSDTAEFFDLRLQHIESAGATVVEASTSHVSESRQNRGSLCRRFNDGRAHELSTCKYKHICSLCRSSSHSKSQCPTTSF